MSACRTQADIASECRPLCRFSDAGIDLSQFTARPPETVRRSIANPDSTKLPAISIPVALPNQTADRLFDINRLRRIINRRRRRSWPCCQGAAEQRPPDKSAYYAGGDLTVLGACRHRQQKRTRKKCNCHNS